MVSALGNLGDAEHIGAELDTEWLPAAVEGLSLQASVAWLDAEYKSNSYALDPADVAVDLMAIPGPTRPSGVPTCRRATNGRSAARWAPARSSTTAGATISMARTPP